MTPRAICSRPRLYLSLLAALPFAPAVAEAAPQKVVVFLAMPGAGKSTFAKALAKKTGNAPIWASGDVIRKAVAERFGTYTIEHDKTMRLEFNQTPGKVGELVAATVMKAEGPLGIVEGFRTPGDLSAFTKIFPEVQIVAIQVGTQRRHERLLERKRPGEDSVAVLRERDASETRLGVRRAMQLATVRVRPGDGTSAVEHSVDALIKQLGLTPAPTGSPPASSAL